MPNDNLADRYLGLGCLGLIVLGTGIGVITCTVESHQQARKEREATQSLAEHERKVEQKLAAIEAAKSPEQREAERKAREAAKLKAEEEQRQSAKAAEEQRKQRAEIRDLLRTSLKATRDLADGPNFVLISYPVVMAETYISENRVMRIPGEMKQASSLAKKRLVVVKQIQKKAERLPNYPDLQRYAQSLYDLEAYFKLTQKAAEAWLAFVNTADRDALDEARRDTQHLQQVWNEFEIKQRELKQAYNIQG